MRPWLPRNRKRGVGEYRTGSRGRAGGDQQCGGNYRECRGGDRAHTAAAAADVVSTMAYVATATAAAVTAQQYMLPMSPR